MQTSPAWSGGALDGSAVAANASRRRLLNAERLQQRFHPLEAIRQDDAQGDAPPEVPAWMAKTPRSRTVQCERSLRAQEHRAGLQAANQHYSPSERRAPDKIVVSTSDPDAALGVDKDHVLRPLYTIQTVRDVDSPFILSYDVFAQATDAGTFSSSLDGDRKRQSGLPAAEADDRVGVCRLERTSRLAAVFGPWAGPRPYGIGLGGVSTQSPDIASVLRSEAQRTVDRGSD